MNERQASVLAYVCAEALVTLTQELIALPSVTGDESAVAGHLLRVLRESDLEVQTVEVEPGRSNVIATWRGYENGPKLLLNGHMDVVPPGDGWSYDPFGGDMVAGKIFGRGAVDMKSGLAAMVGAVQALQRAEVVLGGTLVLTAVIGEERDQSGTRRLVEDGLEADYAIVLEPTDLVPVIAHKGDLSYEIHVRGRPAHSSTPEQGINAIDKMADVIVALRALGLQLGKKQRHPLLGVPTLSVGTIAGGTEPCVVPGSCTITVDRRLLPDEDPQEADAELRELLEGLCAQDGSLDVTFNRTMTALGMEVLSDNPVAKAVRQAATAVLGYDTGFAGMQGTCDANWLVHGAAIPTVVFGPGNPLQAHRADEFIEVEQIVQATRVLTLVALNLLGHGA